MLIFYPDQFPALTHCACSASNTSAGVSKGRRSLAKAGASQTYSTFDLECSKTAGKLLTLMVTGNNRYTHSNQGITLLVNNQSYILLYIEVSPLRSIFILTFNNHVVYFLDKSFSTLRFFFLLVVYVHYCFMHVYFMGLSKRVFSIRQTLKQFACI